MNAIEVKDLAKKFGKFTAVDKVSFQVAQGEIFGFLGPNGAGKTTTINMLTTLLRPTSGGAWVAGFDIVKQKSKVRESIGLVFQEGSLDDSLTAFENLDFHGRLYNIPRFLRQERIQEMLKVVGLEDRKDSLVKTFSGGMKRRLEIARGLIHHPKVLFLDEPTLGLDVQTRTFIWDHILNLREQKNITIFLTTHYMEEAEYTDRIAIIDHGRIIALDTPTNLKKLVGKDVVILISEDNRKAKEYIKTRWDIESEEREATLVLEVASGPEFIPVLVRDLPVRVESISTRKPTLEDVFLHLTGRMIREDEKDNLSEIRQRVKLGRWQ